MRDFTRLKYAVLAAAPRRRASALHYVVTAVTLVLGLGATLLTPGGDLGGLLATPLGGGM